MFFRRYLRGLLVFVLLVALLAPIMACRAEEGIDITDQVKITVPGSRKAWKKAHDRAYKTSWGREDQKLVSLKIELPEGEMTGGIYLCFSVEPSQLKLYSGENAEPFYQEEGPGYANRYIPFEEQKSLRLVLVGGDKGFGLSEFFVISGKQPPTWVQRWQPPLERADMLLLVAHPDDELLWMGGTIPYYAMARQKDIAVAYLTCANPMRRSELLNGLWTAGIRHYPYIAGFRDKRVSGLKNSYKMWGGQERVEEHVVSLYRRLKPQVVLSHDLRGEYGHPAHVICARAAVAALDMAGDEDCFTLSAAEYGKWDVPKLYLHLYEENKIEMDWERMMIETEGMNSLEITRMAFAQHRSQRARYSVDVVGPYSASRFGLVRSLVGDDVNRDDFFENLF